MEITQAIKKIEAFKQNNEARKEISNEVTRAMRNGKFDFNALYSAVDNAAAESEVFMKEFQDGFNKSVEGNYKFEVFTNEDKKAIFADVNTVTQTGAIDDSSDVAVPMGGDILKTNIIVAMSNAVFDDRILKAVTTHTGLEKYQIWEATDIVGQIGEELNKADPKVLSRLKGDALTPDNKVDASSLLSDLLLKALDASELGKVFGNIVLAIRRKLKQQIIAGKNTDNEFNGIANFAIAAPYTAGTVTNQVELLDWAATQVPAKYRSAIKILINDADFDKVANTKDLNGNYLIREESLSNYKTRLRRAEVIADADVPAGTILVAGNLAKYHVVLNTSTPEMTTDKVDALRDEYLVKGKLYADGGAESTSTTPANNAWRKITIPTTL